MATALSEHLNRSSAGHDPDDFQAIAGLKLAGREFGGGNRFPVQLYDDAPWKELLGNEEALKRAGQFCRDFPAVGDEERIVQGGGSIERY